MNFVCLWVLTGLTLVVSDESQPPPAAVRQLLNQHCLRCHNRENAEAGFRVDRLTNDFADHPNSVAWMELRNRINLGEMPPSEELQPKGELIRETSAWVTQRLRETESSSVFGGAGHWIRRMNRHEYTHTVSDLLMIRFPTGESPLDFLPPDGTALGFDTAGSALMLDPSLLSQYYRTATRIASQVVVDGPPQFPTELMRLEFEEIGDSRAIRYLLERRGMRPASDGIILTEGGTRSFGMLRYPGRRDNNIAPISGFYRFTLTAAGIPGSDGRFPRIRLVHSHPDDSMQVLLETEVTAPRDHPQPYSVIVPRDTLGGEVSVRIVNPTSLYMSQRPGEHFMRRNSELGKQGDFKEILRLDGRKVAEGWGGDRSTPDPDKLDLSQFPQVYLDVLEVEGPLYEQWPPAGHRMLLFQGDQADHPEEYLTSIFLRFLPRAWRRPGTREDAQFVVEAAIEEFRYSEDLRAAVRVGLTAALTSPRFLYLAQPASNDDPAVPADNYQLASRLSYFLWSSLPDDDLFAAAESGRLQQPDEWHRQVDRMLSHPRADRLADRFAAQWLKVDQILNFTPDKHLYPEFDEALAEAVRREPLEFFREVFQHDLSVLSFLDSEFLVVNERLARHYGVPDIQGDAFQRVERPENSPRGGLLGMTGVHLAGSDGIRTKPVSRGVYVREVLFNDPPEPPPPNAGEIEPNIRGERLTVRDRLMQHQQIEACAGCHRSIDPYGLALENFNVVGAWRERQDGEEFRGRNEPIIDASGQLPNGETYKTYFEYRSQLLRQADRYRRALAEKMLTFALGRPPLPSDDAALSQIVQDMKASGDTFRVMIHSLTASPLFQE